MTFKVVFVALVTLLVINLSETAPPPSNEYVGCCKDYASSQRELPMRLSTAITSNQQCQTLCGNAGYAFAGTQNGNECWCGYKNCSQGQFSDGFCNKPCPDSTQMCGGPYRNTVYKVPTRYVGCFQDSTTTRSLPYSAYKGDTKNTPNDCIAACKKAGYFFAGVQINDCWCGSQTSNLLLGGQNDCNTPCPGNSTLTCGGNLRNALWRV